MIEVNLLPEERRIPEHTPYPRLIAILLGVALIVGEIFFAVYLWMSPVADARADAQAALKRKNNSKSEADKTNKIVKEKADLFLWQKIVKQLADRRIPLGTRVFQLSSIMPERMWITDYSYELKEKRASGRGAAGMEISRVLVIEGKIAPPKKDTGIDLTQKKSSQLEDDLYKTIAEFKKALELAREDNKDDPLKIGYEISEVKVRTADVSLEETLRKDAPDSITKDEKDKYIIKVPVLEFKVEITLKPLAAVDLTKKPKPQKAAKKK